VSEGSSQPNGSGASQQAPHFAGNALHPAAPAARAAAVAQ